MTARAPLLCRGLAVIAAACAVGAFALAVFYPPMMDLQRLIARIDHATLLHVQDWVRENWGDWVWQNFFVTLLVRPAWLAPLSAGIVFAGLAVSAGTPRRLPGSQQRRN